MVERDVVVDEEEVVDVAMDKNDFSATLLLSLQRGISTENWSNKARQ